MVRCKAYLGMTSSTTIGALWTIFTRILKVTAKVTTSSAHRSTFMESQPVTQDQAITYYATNLTPGGTTYRYLGGDLITWTTTIMTRTYSVSGFRTLRRTDSTLLSSGEVLYRRIRQRIRRGPHSLRSVVYPLSLNPAELDNSLPHLPVNFDGF